MHTKQVQLVCSGGHASVVAEALKSKSIKFNVYDEDERKVGNTFMGAKIRSLDVEGFEGKSFHIALGNNHFRELLHSKFSRHGYYCTIVAEGSKISPSCHLSEGCFVAYGALTAARSIIGLGTILNHGAICEHDSIVGRFCHVAPRATILGGVSLGDRVFVGAGSLVLPNLKICDDVIIGAGSIVTKNIQKAGTYIGNPARFYKE